MVADTRGHAAKSLSTRCRPGQAGYIESHCVACRERLAPLVRPRRQRNHIRLKRDNIHSAWDQAPDVT
jgi:hypothetical protein